MNSLSFFFLTMKFNKVKKVNKMYTSRRYLSLCCLMSVSFSFLNFFSFILCQRFLQRRYRNILPCRDTILSLVSYHQFCTIFQDRCLKDRPTQRLNSQYWDKPWTQKKGFSMWEEVFLEKMFTVKIKVFLKGVSFWVRV